MEETNGDLDSLAESEVLTSVPEVASLRLAIRALDTNGVETYIKKCENPSSVYTDTRKYRTPIHDLVDTYCSRDPMTRSPLNLVKFSQILAQLTQNGLDINEGDVTGLSALHLAATYHGSREVIEALLREGADVNKLDRLHQSALHKAAAAGGGAECNELVRAGAIIHLTDCRGYASVHCAALRTSNVGVLLLLRKLGASINQQDASNSVPGPSPLHVACRHGRIHNVRALLEHGARTDARQGAALTPLHIAAARDMTGQVVESLLEAKAGHNSVDSICGETALHKALIHGLRHNVLLLLRFGASTGVSNCRGETALHCASTHCRDVGLWAALLRASQPNSLTQPDAAGLTPRDRATRCQNAVAQSMLRQYEERLSGSQRLHHRAPGVSPTLARRTTHT